MSEGLTLKGLNNTVQNSDLQNLDLNKRLASEENFTALDAEKLKQDTVELSNKAKKEVKENWIFSVLRNTFGIENPKKTLTSIGLTLATVIGCLFLGNKLSNPTAKLGAIIGEKWANTGLYKGLSGFFSKIANNIKNVAKKSKTLSDIGETLKKRKATPVWDTARGYGQGFRSIFSLTPVDTVEKAFKQKGITSVEEGTKLLRQIVGQAKDEKGRDIASTLAKSVLGDGKSLLRRDFCDILSQGIRKHTGSGSDNVKFTQALIDLEKGIVNGKKVALDFTNVSMVEHGLGGIINSWWPVNIIQGIGKKLHIKRMANFCKGNLGDSLVKYNAVNGSLAKTHLGSLVQKSVTIPTESIGNFTNDKSGLGAFLCLQIMSLYNNVQDAPKGKKLATVADDFVGTMGSIALATPLAFGTTYGLASLRNLEGKTILSKGLKQIGKFFGMGLETIAKDGTVLDRTGNKFIRVLGGVMRFAMIMFVLSPKFSKPIKDVIHKVFGKPYDKAEEEKLKQQKEQEEAIIPELGISQKALKEKIDKNPEALKRLQNDDNLASEITKNPKLLVDLLDNKDVDKKIADSKNIQSPMLQKLTSQQGQTLNNQVDNNNVGNDMELFSSKKSSKEEKTLEQQQEDLMKDSATYIPSSAFVAVDNIISPEMKSQYDNILANADKVLKKAEKFI